MNIIDQFKIFQSGIFFAVTLNGVTRILRSENVFVHFLCDWFSLMFFYLTFNRLLKGLFLGLHEYISWIRTYHESFICFSIRRISKTGFDPIGFIHTIFKQFCLQMDIKPSNRTTILYWVEWFLQKLVHLKISWKDK